MNLFQNISILRQIFFLNEFSFLILIKSMIVVIISSVILFWWKVRHKAVHAAQQVVIPTVNLTLCRNPSGTLQGSSPPIRRRSGGALHNTMTGIQQLARLGNKLPVVNVISGVLDDVMEILLHLKSGPESAMMFRSKLDRTALILSGIMDSSLGKLTNSNSSKYEVFLNELYEQLVSAHVFCEEFNKRTWWSQLFGVKNPKERFDEYDQHISRIVSEISLLLSLSQDTKTDTTLARMDDLDKGPHSQIKNPSIKAFWKSALNPSSKVEIEVLIEYICSYYDNSITRSVDVTDETVEKEIVLLKSKLQRGLARIDANKDNAIDVFELNRATKHIDTSLDFHSTLLALCGPITKLIPPMNPDDRKTITITGMLWGKALCCDDCSYPPLVSSPVSSPDIYENILDSSREMMNVKDAKDVILKSYRSSINNSGGISTSINDNSNNSNSGIWTLVTGKSHVGKSFRLLYAAHELLNENEAVIWIDLKAIKTHTDLLSSISTQLSLGLACLEEVWIALESLVKNIVLSNTTSTNTPNNSVNQCSIVLDHVLPDVSILQILSPLFNKCKILQSKYDISVILVCASDLSSPPSSTYSTTATMFSMLLYRILFPETTDEIKVCDNSVEKQSVTSMMNIIEILPLSESDAVQLAYSFHSTDPLLLAKVSKYLPGLIKNFHSLPSNFLLSLQSCDIASPSSSPPSSSTSFGNITSGGNGMNGSNSNSGRLSMSPEVSNIPSSSSSSLQRMKAKSRISFRRMKRGEVIADSLTYDQKLVAHCLYHPLKKGIIFSKSLTLYLCRDVLSYLFEDDVDRLNRSFESLVLIGWIQVVGDQGFVIGKDSILPHLSNDPLSFNTNTRLFDILNPQKQWKDYLTYWIDESIAVNEVLLSKDQLLGCARFDSSMEHFGVLFDWIIEVGLSISSNFMNTVTGSNNTEGITNQVSNINTNVDINQSSVHLSSDLNLLMSSDFIYTCISKIIGKHVSLFRLRFSDAFTLSLRQSTVSILCNGDSSGMIPDDRYWGNDIHRKQITIKAVIDFGWSLLRNGQYEEAERIFHNIKRFVNSKENQTENSFYDEILSHLGPILRLTGRHEEAVAVNEECVAIRSAMIGPTSRATLLAMFNLAISYRSIGRLQDALDMYDKVFQARIEIYGPMHTAVAEVYYNKANVLADMSRYEESLELFKKSLDIRTVVLGDIHYRTGDTYAKIGEVLVSLQRMEEAKIYFGKARDIYEVAVGLSHQKAIDTIRKLQQLN